MGNSRRNRVVAALGAGGMLVTVLGATGAPAQASTPPKACVAIEALVGDGVSGPGLGGEVLRVTPGGQSTLTTNSSPPGSPPLDAPSDMAFLPNGDIVVTDEGFTGFVPDVVEVNPATGGRTLISGRGRGSGPALAVPDTVAVEASGDILVSNEGVTGGTQLLRIDPATGDRVVLSANGTGTGPGDAGRLRDARRALRNTRGWLPFSGAPEDQPVSPLHVRDMRGVRVDAIETRNRSS